MASFVPSQAKVINLGRKPIWTSEEIAKLLGSADFEVHAGKSSFDGNRRVVVRKHRGELSWNITASAVACFLVCGPAVILHPNEEIKF